MSGMPHFLKRQPKIKVPSNAESARAKIRELTNAISEKRPPVTPPPAIKSISSRDLERELDNEDTPNPRGRD